MSEQHLHIVTEEWTESGELWQSTQLTPYEFRMAYRGQRGDIPGNIVINQRLMGRARAVIEEQHKRQRVAESLGFGRHA